MVDRIVTGYPRSEASAFCEKLGYEDTLLNTAEPFGFWVIEGPQSIKEELPFEKTGLPIMVVDDHTPYKQRKVRILNGAHTAMVMAAYLADCNIVRECMEDATIRKYLEDCMYEEVIPTLDLPKEELMSFAKAVEQRFENPFIDHSLLSICLNSTSKWKARVMPTILAYQERKGTLPKHLVFSFAAYVAFYHCGKVLENGTLIGERNGEKFVIQDDAWALEFYYAHRNDDAETLIDAVVGNTDMWGDSLINCPGFKELALSYFKAIQAEGTRKVMEAL